MITRFYKAVSTPEKKGAHIGWFRSLCAVFGGLTVAYSAMTLLVLLMPGKTEHTIFIPFLFTTFAWACAALWISLSPDKLSALLRSLIPSILFTMGVFYFT